MDSNCIVTGTVQTRINGVWHEQTIRMELYAVDREHAIEKALRTFALSAQQSDPMALTRWYSKPRVEWL